MAIALFYNDYHPVIVDFCYSGNKYHKILRFKYNKKKENLFQEK